MTLIERLQEHRKSEKKLAWEGTFAEYLELVEKNPDLAIHAHARIYNMIMDKGVEEQNGHKKYKFFESEMFGLDQCLQRN